MGKLFIDNMKVELKNVAFWIILIIFTFICGTYLPIAKAGNLTAMEYVLLVISNHYYLVYGFFFYSIYWIFCSIRKKRTLVLIRFKTYASYYRNTWENVLLKIVMFVVLHIVIASIIGICELDLSNTFAGSELDGYYSESYMMLSCFQHIFKTPYIAVSCVAIYLIMGNFFIYEIIFTLQELKGDQAVIIGIIVLIFNAMIGFQTQIDESFLNVLFINNYFILHHPLLLVGKYAVVVNILIMLIVSIIIWKRIVHRNNKRTTEKKCIYIDKCFYINLKGIVFFAVVMFVLRVIRGCLNGYNAGDIAYLLLQGYSKSGVNILNMLYYLAYFILPIFILNIFLENEKKEHTVLVMFRLGRKKIYQKCVEYSSGKILLKYVFIYGITQLFCFVIVASFTFKNEYKYIGELFEFYGLTEDTLLVGIISSIIFYILELVVLYEINMVLNKVVHNTAVAFIMTFLGYVLSVIVGSQSISKLLPFGNASLEGIVFLLGTNEITDVVVKLLVIYLLWMIVPAIINKKLQRRGVSL